MTQNLLRFHVRIFRELPVGILIAVGGELPVSEGRMTDGLFVCPL